MSLHNDVFINHEGGVSPQIAFGKPGGTVNVKLGLIFNHEEHEGHEGNTKVKDIAPLGLMCWLAIIGYKDYAPMGLSGPGKPDGTVNVMLRMARRGKFHICPYYK